MKNKKYNEIINFIKDYLEKNRIYEYDLDENTILSSIPFDSFGYTMLLIELDEKYGIFDDIENDDPFSVWDHKNANIKTIAKKIKEKEKNND